jgi:hypothetical protein
MQSLTKLLFKVRTPIVLVFCVVWLLLNIVSVIDYHIDFSAKQSSTDNASGNRHYKSYLRD